MPLSPHAQPGAGPTLFQDDVSAFITDRSFPCVGAKSALNQRRMRFAEYSALGRQPDAEALCDRLQDFSEEFPEPGNVPVSLVAMFRDSVPDEMAFERALWRHIQLMHNHDSRQFGWDTSVSNDPERTDFSLSIAGRAFFVVGLFPDASRLARRAPVPCIVFNFHNQFEQFKSSGKYQSMQAVVRARDMQLQGSVNPVLARFGESSEARQYFGRAVDAAWRCPFHANGAANA